ncbi:MAG: sigma-70 family polymerase sigma factor [Glaciihabitans sp.]|nr:sigma-70 family polymerase sigma factor [Glaciihabitans sp.]
MPLGKPHPTRDNIEAREWIRGMSEADESLTSSDETLIANARSGDQGAFAELWRRHYRSGARVARQFTSSIDADDLVSEAYTRIYQRVLAGGGPSGAFRPYLYTTIRNLASSWGAASRDVQVDDIQDFEDPTTIDDPVAVALDRTLTARAFRSLPDRWQSVLWYTEVEGMDPHEVAPLLGMSANGVAALSYRAREGLRKAWLQAHVSEPGTSEFCRWTMSRLGEAARHSLTTREQERIDEHLQTCAKCAIVSEEVEEVGSHLAMILLPIILGGVAGGVLLSTLGHAGAAVAASAAIPSVPASFAVLSAPAAFAPAVGSGLAMGAASGVSALVGTLAVVATIGGSIAIGLAPSQGAQDAGQTTSASAPHTNSPSNGTSSAGHSGSGLTPIGTALGALSTPSATDPSNLGGTAGVGGLAGGLTNTVGSVAGGLGNDVSKVVGGVKTVIVAPLIGALTPSAPPAGHTAAGGAPVTAKVQLAGKGTPGATVSAQAGGMLYGTAKVASNGRWSLLVTALPAGTGTLQLQQRLRVLGIELPINIPLTLNTAALGIVIQLLN